jgi:hypothetical protein
MTRDTPQNATQLLSLEATSTDIFFGSIIFDGNVDDENILARNDIAGYSWLGRVIGDSSVTFYDCDFINSADCGFVGAGDGVIFDGCVFYNMGEHPIYTSNDANDWLIKKCTFLNWGKIVRGYGLKLTECSNVVAQDNIFDHDEDGLGVQNDVPEGGGGSYLFVVYGTNIDITRSKCYTPYLPTVIDSNSYSATYLSNTITEGSVTISSSSTFSTHKYHYGD